MKKFFANPDIDNYSKIYTLLGYKEIKRKKTPFKNLSLVTYKKEKDIPNYKILKDRYAPYGTIPFFFVILCAVVAFILATIFLVMTFTSKEDDKLLYFFSFMLPTFFFVLLATGISFYRYFVELKNIERVVAIPLLEKEVNK